MTKYFTIPFKNVPDNPEYTVWYAAWSNEKPVVEPFTDPPMVIGATSGDLLPPSAVPLAETGNTKEPPPKPPPLTGGSADAYQSAFAGWLVGVMGD